jgi:hypothetical protein
MNRINRTLDVLSICIVVGILGLIVGTLAGNAQLPSDTIMGFKETQKSAIDLQKINPAIFDTQAFQMEALNPEGKGKRTGILDLGMPTLNPSLGTFINTTTKIPVSIFNQNNTTTANVTDLNQSEIVLILGAL